LNILVQRQFAALLEIDTTINYKKESDYKQIIIGCLKKITIAYKISEKGLITSWLGFNIIQIVEMEKVGNEALRIVLINAKSND
jgi:hypothetical protein